MGNGNEGSSFLLGLSGEIIHIYPPHGRDREAVLDSGIEKALCHILWGELLAESPQAVDLFLIVLHQNYSPGNDGGLKIGGIVIGRLKIGVVLGYKGNTYAGTSVQQLHLAPLTGTMKIEAVTHTDKGEGKTVGSILPGCQSGYPVGAAVNNGQTKVPVLCAVCSSHDDIFSFTSFVIHSAGSTVE